MSPRVSLSLRAAREIYEQVESQTSHGLESEMEQLREAIAKATRASATRRKLARPKAEKRRAKRQRTSAVRSVVVERSGGFCEGCPNTAGAALSLDHFFGRARAESVETCWLLCANCHHWKTMNHPEAEFWLVKFASHCERHGYSAEAARARKQLAWVESKARAAP